jgi:integrase
VLHGLAREHQPKSNDTRVRDRERIDRLIADKRRPLEDRTLWSMLYSTAARAEEVLRLDVSDLDRANRRARTIGKGGKADELLYDIGTARMLGQLLGRRTKGPIFLSTRVAPDDGTTPTRDVDPASRRRRMTYQGLRHVCGTDTPPTSKIRSERAHYSPVRNGDGGFVPVHRHVRHRRGFGPRMGVPERHARRSRRQLGLPASARPSRDP